MSLGENLKDISSETLSQTKISEFESFVRISCLYGNLVVYAVLSEWKASFYMVFFLKVTAFLFVPRSLITYNINPLL